MAYTGILLRGDTFNNIYLDPPIAREVVMAGQWLGAGTDDGTGGTNIYYLNLAQLEKIGVRTDDQGAYLAGFNTTDLPIVFDGVGGYIKKETDYMFVNATHKWWYAGVRAIKTGTHESVTFTDGTNDATVNITELVFAQYKPAFSALTTVDVVCTYTTGTQVRIYNETTGQHLGFITSSGGTLTFGTAQTIGDVITAAAVDTNYNYSAKIADII